MVKGKLTMTMLRAIIEPHSMLNQKHSDKALVLCAHVRYKQIPKSKHLLAFMKTLFAEAVGI